MNKPNANATGKAAQASPLDLAESVAGEEDPGASLDLAVNDTGSNPARSGAEPPMSPGDQAPAGTPGTGEGVCPRCGGSGKLANGDCPECQGTGRVTVGIGGA